MFDLIFNKDDSFFCEKKVSIFLGSTSRMTPNSDLQFIHKESGNSMTTAKSKVPDCCHIGASLTNTYHDFLANLASLYPPIPLSTPPLNQ